MKSFKIALAQFSPHIGNLEANAQKMLEQANEAKKQNADLIIFPELSSYWLPSRRFTSTSKPNKTHATSF